MVCQFETGCSLAICEYSILPFFGKKLSVFGKVEISARGQRNSWKELTVAFGMVYVLIIPAILAPHSSRTTKTEKMEKASCVLRDCRFNLLGVIYDQNSDPINRGYPTVRTAVGVGKKI